MVTSVTSLGRNGLYDWVVQRVSAVILLAWLLFLLGVFVFNPDMQYADWRALFNNAAVRIFTLAGLLALCAHAWIGMWTIATDYLTVKLLGRAATFIRLVFLLACLAILLTYFVWCIEILWSN